MSAFNRILETAIATQKKIALPEASDDRVLNAAAEIARQKLAQPILIGNATQIGNRARELGVSLESLSIIDPFGRSVRLCLHDDGR